MTCFLTHNPMSAVFRHRAAFFKLFVWATLIFAFSAFVVSKASGAVVITSITESPNHNVTDRDCYLFISYPVLRGDPEVDAFHPSARDEILADVLSRSTGADVGDDHRAAFWWKRFR